MQTNPEWQADKALYEKEHGGKKISNVAYAAILGNLETQGTQDVAAPGDITGGGGTGGSGPSASWLDEIVKKTRDLFNANEQLTIGYKASGDALAAFYKKGKVALTGMAGLQTKLAGAGLGRDIISNILGMPKEEADKWMKMFFKGGSVTEFAKNVNAIMYANKAGDYIAETQLLTNDYKEQGKALKVLTAAGTDQATMQAMLNDENVRSIVYGATLTGKIADQVAKTKELTKAYIGQLAVERLKKDPRQATIDSANIKIDTIQKQNAVYQNGLEIISKQEEKISAVYDKQIAALNEVKSINDQISRQKQGELDLADALSRGDIGAAAKAAESIRAQRAQDAVDNQVKALEDAKKRAIDSISVEIDGKKYTKLELTDKIGAAELNILEIQKDQVVQQELSIAKDKERLDALAKIKAAELAVIAAKNSGLKNNKVGTGKSGASGSGAGGSGTGSGAGANGSSTEAKPLESVTSTTLSDTKVVSDQLSKLSKGSLSKPYPYGGNLSTAIKKVSIDTVTANKLTGVTKANDILREASLKGFYNAATGGWKDRGTLSGAQKETFDKLKSDYDAQIAKNKTIGVAEASSREAIISSLPKSVQDALAILKNRLSDRKALADKEAIAKTTYNSRIKKEIGLDKNGRPNIQNAKDQGIFDSIWAEYSKSLIPLSLFDSRIAQLERNLTNAGLSKTDVQGLIGKYASGGHITGPGTGTSDSIPAMLSNGEFVVKASAVDKIGVGVLNRLNQTGDISRFALGGLSTAAFKTPMMAKGGEFVMSNYSIKQFSTDAANAINSGSATSVGDSVYNYSVNVNVSNAGANANDIARTVINQIRQIDSQRIRSNNF
jgi:hypothetical protein